MSIEEEFTEFLFSQTGVVSPALDKLMGNKSDVPVFFNPYQSKSDVFFRAASVVTAPIALSVFALEAALFAVGYAFKALWNLVTLNPAEALVSLRESAISLLCAALGLTVAIASPVINAVDLIGSIKPTLNQKSDSEEFDLGAAPTMQ